MKESHLPPPPSLLPGLLAPTACHELIERQYLLEGGLICQGEVGLHEELGYREREQMFTILIYGRTNHENVG